MNKLVMEKTTGPRQMGKSDGVNDEFELAVSVIAEAMKQSRWLRLAYLSYYRPGVELSLYDVGLLDWNNIECFRLICNLRNMNGWTDERLYELQLLAKSMG